LPEGLRGCNHPILMNPLKKETASMNSENRSGFRQKHLTGINHLEKKDIETILSLAQDYAEQIKDKNFKTDRLHGACILTLFFEDSTRTRVSFEMAAKRLGADVVNMDIRTSSLNKGETFSDTIMTLNAMRPDGIVLRHSDYGAPDYVAARVDCPVINAGDSYREHPTQALLDALTMKQHYGKLDGLRVSIVGDIAHSRVANSNAILLTRMGAAVNFVAPSVLMPEKTPVPNVICFDNLKDGLKDADVVMVIRPQKERMEKVLIDDAAYFRDFGMTHDKLAFAKRDTIVLDPGPFIRNLQISDALADDPTRFHYNQQVSNGIAVRMAVMDLLVGCK
jgi:aspartate carbamoyltransferase catalytic subunit